MPIIRFFLSGFCCAGPTPAALFYPSLLRLPLTVTPFSPLPSFRGPVRPNRSAHFNGGQTTRRVEPGDAGLDRQHLSSPGQLVRR